MCIYITIQYITYMKITTYKGTIIKCKMTKKSHSALILDNIESNYKVSILNISTTSPDNEQCNVLKISI